MVKKKFFLPNFMQWFILTSTLGVCRRCCTAAGWHRWQRSPSRNRWRWSVEQTHSNTQCCWRLVQQLPRHFCRTLCKGSIRCTRPNRAPWWCCTPSNTRLCTNAQAIDDRCWEHRCRPQRASSFDNRCRPTIRCNSTLATFCRMSNNAWADISCSERINAHVLSQIGYDII